MDDFSRRPSYHEQDAPPYLKSTSPEFLPTHTPKWLQVSHDLIILINNLGPILLGKLEPFVKSFRWIPPIPPFVLFNGISERLALALNHLPELCLGLNHQLRNRMYNGLALGSLEEVRGLRYPFLQF